jgi:hypothetical protein
MKSLRKKDLGDDDLDEREIKANITKKARRIKKEVYFQAQLNNEQSNKSFGTSLEGKFKDFNLSLSKCTLL